MADMVPLKTIQESRFENTRNDLWWIKPLLQGAYLGLFVLYALWAVVIDFHHYEATIEGTHFVSPFFNPDINVNWWPDGLSPGLMLIWAPVGFRATCYYARKVYYRAFFADPPACAVGEFQTVAENYKGENKWPYIINNLHRYFFYGAFILSIFHFAEFLSVLFNGGLGTTEGAIATIILFFDAIFLALYTLSCHSCKHIVGGGMNCNSCSSITKARYKGWKFIKKININHHVYFWLSLTTVLLADLYIRFGLAYGWM